MSSKLTAIAFYARDHLSQEFPKIGKNLTEFKRVYIVSKPSEAAMVSSIDTGGFVYDISEYISRAENTDTNSKRYEDLFSLISKDRYLNKMSLEDIEPVVVGFSVLLDELGSKFKIVLCLDEPVSGFINDALNKWVKKQGGRPAHYNLSWVPGYLFFVSDSAEAEPIELGVLEGASEIVEKHITLRLKNQNQPRYIYNYHSTARRLKSCLEFAAKGWYRKLIVANNFMDGDPWPHFYQAKSLAYSFTKKYKTISELGFNDMSKLVVFPIHYEPEAVISYFSPYKNQLDLANKLFEKLPAGAILVVKEHPSQPGATRQHKWRDLVSKGRVTVVSGLDPLSELLEYPSIVVSIGSKAALETSLLGRASYVVGKPHFRIAPGVQYIDDLDDIIFKWEKSKCVNEDIQKWYAGFLSKYCVRGQFIRGMTRLDNSAEILRKLAKR